MMLRARIESIITLEHLCAIEPDLFFLFFKCMAMLQRRLHEHYNYSIVYNSCAQVCVQLVNYLLPLHSCTMAL